MKIPIPEVVQLVIKGANSY